MPLRGRWEPTTISVRFSDVPKAAAGNRTTTQRPTISQIRIKPHILGKLGGVIGSPSDDCEKQWMCQTRRPVTSGLKERPPPGSEKGPVFHKPPETLSRISLRQNGKRLERFSPAQTSGTRDRGPTAGPSVPIAPKRNSFSSEFGTKKRSSSWNHMIRILSVQIFTTPIW